MSRPVSAVEGVEHRLVGLGEEQRAVGREAQVQELLDPRPQRDGGVPGPLQADPAQGGPVGQDPGLVDDLAAGPAAGRARATRAAQAIASRRIMATGPLALRVRRDRGPGEAARPRDRGTVTPKFVADDSGAGQVSPDAATGRGSDGRDRSAVGPPAPGPGVHPPGRSVPPGRARRAGSAGTGSARLGSAWPPRGGRRRPSSRCRSRRAGSGAASGGACRGGSPGEARRSRTVATTSASLQHERPVGLDREEGAAEQGVPGVRVLAEAVGQGRASAGRGGSASSTSWA